MRFTKYRCDMCNKELKGFPISHWENDVSDNCRVAGVVFKGTSRVNEELCWSCYQKAIDKFNTIVQKTEREE